MSQRPAPGDLVLDHLAHFVPDLEAAGKALAALGIISTPVSHHQVGGKPAGTSNRCVMLEEGYLEILCASADTPNAARVRAHMARYPGIHLCCFGTGDAAFEHQRLAAHGFTPDPVVHLERKTEDHLRFNVVYVPAERMPEGRVQYCEHLTPELLWKKEFVNPLSLREIYVVAEKSAVAAARWGRFTGLMPRPERGLVRLASARGSVVIGTRSALSKILFEVPKAPALAGYALACADPAALAERCREGGLKVKKSGRRYVVMLPPALGSTWVLVPSVDREKAG